MNRAIPNNDYKNAKYEISAVGNGGTVANLYPVRFNEPCPPDVWADAKKLNPWLKEHSIPPFVMEEYPDPK